MKRKLIPLLFGFTLTWNIVPDPADGPIDGFKIELGSKTGVYSQTIDIPNGTAREYKNPGYDTSKAIFVRVTSYSQWGQSPSAEYKFGGKPSPTVFISAAPTTP